MTLKAIHSIRPYAGLLIENLKTWLVVKPLQFICSKKPLEDRLAAMREMPEGSVGKDLVTMLDAKGLKLIPGFQNHDLNHLVLGYGMESEEELCMQAYLIGNRYYQWQCFIFLSSAVILPWLWPTLLEHFRLGRQNVSVNELEFEDCLFESTAIMQQRYATQVSHQGELVICQQ